MELININIIGLQTLKIAIDGAANMFGIKTRLPITQKIHRRYFASKDNFIALFGFIKPCTHEAFSIALLVFIWRRWIHFRRIPKIHPFA